MRKLKVSGVYLCLILLHSFGIAQLPEGFVNEEVKGSWDYVVGFVFDENGEMYAWERSGKVFLVKNDQKVNTPILDISDEVGFFGDHGMLSMVLDPNFLSNGYLYLLYAVDRHHLLYFGTSNYDSTISLTHEASMGRVTRYTLNKVDSFRSVMPGSRKVLLGGTIDDGLPLMHVAHGVGDLLFGRDGSLLISCGDGSTFKTEFIGGGREGTYARQGLDDGILKEKEDIGSYRSQLVDCHNGKVLRIHPETGFGVPSNPFYDSQNPKSPRSRVWALGFRNPYRMTLLPGTGSHDMKDGNPGTIYVGDVGSGWWEELNIITEPGQNFGWPLWEGLHKHWEFSLKPAYNQDAPNPLFGQGNCQHPFFHFHDLILEKTQNQFPFWENNCNRGQEIPQDYHRFIHKRPALSYSNFLFNTPTKTEIGLFDNSGNAISESIKNAPWGYEGDVFDGICIFAGQFYTGNNFPSIYHNRYFIADYNGWIRILDFDSLGHIVKAELFAEGLENIVHLDIHPQNGCLYYVKYKEKKIHKICYGTDPAPVINLQFDRDHGPSPLTVQFDASASKDPQGQPISFFWDFGDGQTSTDTAPTHVFSTTSDEPVPFNVVLTVTDSIGNSSKKEVTVSLNNTPPKVLITSIEDGSSFATNGINKFRLEAAVYDQEHTDNQLKYEWQTFLLHNNHLHPEPIDTNKITNTFLEPAGCDGESYSYRIALTVYDAAGLFGNHEISLWPNCDSFPTEFEILSASFENEKVNLDWKTKWESDIADFEIERAPDRLNFEQIGSIPATGNTQSPHSYQFIDNQPNLGPNFYRLKIKTAPDRYQYSAPLEVENFKGLGIDLYPNPTVSIIAIRLKDMKESASLELFEFSGKKVEEFNWVGIGKSFKQFSVNHLPGGMYFYRLRNGTDFVDGKLLIIR